MRFFRSLDLPDESGGECGELQRPRVFIAEAVRLERLVSREDSQAQRSRTPRYRHRVDGGACGSEIDWHIECRARPRVRETRHRRTPRGRDRPVPSGLHGTARSRELLGGHAVGSGRRLKRVRSVLSRQSVTRRAPTSSATVPAKRAYRSTSDDVASRWSETLRRACSAFCCASFVSANRLAFWSARAAESAICSRFSRSSCRERLIGATAHGENAEHAAACPERDDDAPAHVRQLFLHVGRHSDDVRESLEGELAAVDRGAELGCQVPSRPDSRGHAMPVVSGDRLDRIRPELGHRDAIHVHQLRDPFDDRLHHVRRVERRRELPCRLARQTQTIDEVLGRFARIVAEHDDADQPCEAIHDGAIDIREWPGFRTPEPDDSGRDPSVRERGAGRHRHEPPEPDVRPEDFGGSALRRRRRWSRWEHDQASPGRAASLRGAAIPRR